jgi:hypothetical protein
MSRPLASLSIWSAARVVSAHAQPLVGGPTDFDALLEPIERTGVWESGELPETYPTAP